MITISRTQIERLPALLFADDLAERLRRDYSDVLHRDRVEGDLAAHVRRWIAEAATLKIVERSDVDLFVKCKLIFGPAFGRSDGCEWAYAIVRRPDLSGEEKMDQVDEHMLFGLEAPQ